MEKKRSGWFTFLMYLVIAVFGSIIIYSIVSNFTNKHTQVTSGSLIQLAYDDTDKYSVTDATIIQNGDETTVNLGVKNSESGEQLYYTCTCDTSLVYTVHSFDGLNTSNISIYDALFNQVVKNTSNYTEHWN